MLNQDGDAVKSKIELTRKIKISKKVYFLLQNLHLLKINRKCSFTHNH